MCELPRIPILGTSVNKRLKRVIIRTGRRKVGGRIGMGRTIVTEQDVHEETSNVRHTTLEFLEKVSPADPGTLAPTASWAVGDTSSVDIEAREWRTRVYDEIRLAKREGDIWRARRLNELLPLQEELVRSVNHLYREAQEELVRSVNHLYREALKAEEERLKTKYLEAFLELASKQELEKQAETLSPRVDDYTNRLLKYIPAESVALYLTLQGIILSGANASRSIAWLWVVLSIGIIGTPLYLWRITKVSKAVQLAVSTAAFIVWVFALGGAFSSLSWYEPFIGSLALVIFTFFAPLISPDVLSADQE